MMKVKKLTKKQQKTQEQAIEEGEKIRNKCRDKIYTELDKRIDNLTNEELTERARKIETSIYNYAIRSINMSSNKMSTMKSVPKSSVLLKTHGKKKDTHVDTLERTLSWTKNWIKMPNSKLEPKWNCMYFRQRYINKATSIISNLRDTRNLGFIKAIVEKSVPLREIANLKADEIFPELWKPIKEKVWKKEVVHGHGIDDINDGVEQCGKCKSMKTTYYSLQTRSADEPMTNFFTCHNCGKHWKT